MSFEGCVMSCLEVEVEVKWERSCEGGTAISRLYPHGRSGLEPPELSYWPFVVPHNFRPRDLNPGTSDWEARMLTAQLSNRGPLFYFLTQLAFSTR